MTAKDIIPTEILPPISWVLPAPTTRTGRGSAVRQVLYGLPGRNIAETDAAGRRIPFGFDTQYLPQDGYDLVLTIDEVIQHFAEKAVEEAVINSKAKKGTAIIMDPKRGTY